MVLTFQRSKDSSLHTSLLLMSEDSVNDHIQMIGDEMIYMLNLFIYSLSL